MTTLSHGVVERLTSSYTGAVHDVLASLGRPEQVLPSEIRPLHGSGRLAGQVFAMEGRVDETRHGHDVLAQWTSLLASVPPGVVVVCQPNDGRFAHMGELSAATLRQRGVAGYVVDGGCRDCDAVVETGLPVWCRYRTPAAGRWLCEAAPGPITIGTAQIRSGDILVADGDGGVVVPRELAADVADAVALVVGDERRVREALLAGGDAHEVFLEHGRF